VLSHKLKYMTTGLGILCVIGLVCLPFLSNGVFFWHGQLVLDTVLLFLSLAIICAAIFIPKFRNFIFAEERLLYSDIAILLFTFLYIIAIFYASSMNLSVEGAIDAIALLLPYAFFRFKPLRNLFASWIGAGFVLASIPIVIIGLANGWGQLHYPSATEMTPQHQLQIASVFQYHNAFAAFTASIATGLLVWVVKNSNLWLRAIAAGIAALNITGLILSGSRGALALWIGVMVLILIGLRSLENDGQKLRNRFMANAYLTLMAGAIGYVLTNHANNIHSPAYGWLGVVMSFVIPIILIMARHVILKSKILLRGNKGLSIWIGIGFVTTLIGAILKSHALIAKLESYHIHQMDVIQRFIFWRDGFKLFTRNPISGSGSGAWQAMYEKVQSYPYISTRVHSFGMDVLMEVGLIGFACLIFFIWPAIRATVWPNKEQLRESTPYQMAIIAAGLMLFVHSLMDWDMSFEFLMILFYAAIGAAAPFSHSIQIKSANHKNIHFALLPLGMLSLIGLLTTSLGLRAESIAHHAQLKGGSDASSMYLNAYHIAPYNDAYLTSAAITLLQTNTSKASELQAESMIQHAESLNPYSPTIASTFAHLSYILGNYDVTFHQAMLAMNNAPFDPGAVSLALTAGTVDGLRQAASNPSGAKAIFEQVEQLYNTALARQKIVAGLPSYLPPSTPYQLDPFSFVSVAATKYVLGDTSDAAAIAVNQMKSQEQHAREVGKLIVLMVNDAQQVQGYVSSTPSVKSSYQLLLEAIHSVK
jgi:hypothetical protein